MLERFNQINLKRPVWAVLLLLLTSLLSPADAQPGLWPTDNPYRTAYNVRGVNQHWTDSIRWNNVIPAALRTNLIVNGVVDSLVFDSTINLLNQQGGGVLFFDPGQYEFNFNVELPTGVVLRGADPTITSAKDTTYTLPAILKFPHYVPTFSGSGTPNGGYFKTIGGKTNAHNLALVNLDIDGASIGFHPHAWTTVATRTGNTRTPLDVNYNVLVYGVRSNNTALPDPSVPTNCQTNNGGAWQRWVWSFSANIDLFVSRNAIVANCRLNDNPTMSFNQPNFFYGDGANCTPSAQCAAMAADGSDAKFDVTAHYGIVVNRGKINKDGQISGNFAAGPNGPYGIYAWQGYGEPDTEPYLFVPGIEVRDNWVYKTSRVGIQTSGFGAKILNNKILDKNGKNVWLHPYGIRCGVNNAATFENRGIDVSGWDVTVSYNDVAVETATIRNGPFMTVDGEGILVQECCGGSSVRNYTFTHNYMRRGQTGYIGLWAMRDLYNVRVDSNNLNCENIFYWADYAGTPIYFKIINGSIKGNQYVNDINVTGTTGGSNMNIADNLSCGGTTLRAPCYATTSNNTGFSLATCTQAPSLTLPTVTIDPNSSSSTILIGANANLDWTSIDADSVRIWDGAVAITGWMDAQTTNTYTLNQPNAGMHYLTVEGKNASGRNYSAVHELYVEYIIVSLDDKLTNKITLSPNPTSNHVAVNGLTDSEASITITDLTGKVVGRTESIRKGQLIDVTGLTSGTYLIRITQGDQSTVKRLVKN